MNDDTPAIQNSPTPGEPSQQPDAGRETAAKKKRSKVSAKAATAAIEARIGHKFGDPALLATAFTHVSALKPARNRASYQRNFSAKLGLIVSDMLYGLSERRRGRIVEAQLADPCAGELRRCPAKIARKPGRESLGRVAPAPAPGAQTVLGGICEAVIGQSSSTAAMLPPRIRRAQLDRADAQAAPAAARPRTVLQEWAQSGACRRRSIARSAHRTAS
jgi:ribonuclease-3